MKHLPLAFLLVLLTARAASSQNLTRGSGPVMTAQKVYLIFWDWRTSRDNPTFHAPGDSEETVESVFSASASAPWVGVANQYSAGGFERTVNASPPFVNHTEKVPGGMLGGVYPETTHEIAAYSLPCAHHLYEICPTDAGIEAVLRDARAAFPDADLANSVFLILLPQYVYKSDCGGGCNIYLPDTCDGKILPVPPFCADNARGEHAQLWLEGNDRPATTYGIISFQPTGASGDSSFYGEGATAYHEALEAMTDPVLGSGWVATAPGDKILTEKWWENMDPCESHMMVVQAQPSTYPHSGLIQVPAQWSNRSGAGACTFRYTRRASRWTVDATSVLREESLDDPDGTASVSRTHTFTPWGPMLVPRAPLSVVNWTYDRVDLFGLDTSGQMLHAWTWWDKTATSLAYERFQPPPYTYFDGAATVTSQGFGQLSVFATVTTGGSSPFSLLVYKSYDYSTGWVPAAAGDWRVLSTPWLPSGRVAATSWGPRRLDVFYLDSSRTLRHGWSDDAGATWSWSGWAFAYQPTIVGSPAVASWGDHRLDLVVAGDNGALYHQWYDHDSAGNWEQIGDASRMSGPISIVALGDQRLHIEAQDVWGVIEQRDFDWQWKPWTYASGTYQFGASPAGAAW